jgi:hypothetical protein
MGVQYGKICLWNEFMFDKLNIEIETRALQEGSYIEAIKDFCEEKEIYDYQDITILLHPIIINKLKAEFINKNYFKDKKNLTKISNLFN